MLLRAHPRHGPKHRLLDLGTVRKGPGVGAAGPHPNSGARTQQRPRSIAHLQRTARGPSKGVHRAAPRHAWNRYRGAAHRAYAPAVKEVSAIGVTSTLPVATFRSRVAGPPGRAAEVVTPAHQCQPLGTRCCFQGQYGGPLFRQPTAFVGRGSLPLPVARA